MQRDMSNVEGDLEQTLILKNDVGSQISGLQTEVMGVERHPYNTSGREPREDSISNPTENISENISSTSHLQNSASRHLGTQVLTYIVRNNKIGYGS